MYVEIYTCVFTYIHICIYVYTYIFAFFVQGPQHLGFILGSSHHVIEAEPVPGPEGHKSRLRPGPGFRGRMGSNPCYIYRDIHMYILYLTIYLYVYLCQYIHAYMLHCARYTHVLHVLHVYIYMYTYIYVHMYVHYMCVPGGLFLHIQAV